METIYFTTRSFIRHEDNVIDFEEYREKLTAQQALLAEPEEPEAPAPQEERTAPAGRRHTLVRLRDSLDLAASAAMILVAVVTAVMIL
ncbi:MAG: hypothetical protein LUD82_02880 [Clostridiales bacterium]|nr:hypothetical protein [Clostridiales bacterium]MCD8126440.1 hypothetical protein [Clostridiales bacterium]